MADNVRSLGSRRDLALRVSLFGIGLLLVSAIAVSFCLADEYEASELHIELAPGIPIEWINLRYGTTTLDELPPLYRLGLPRDGHEGEYLDQLQNDPLIVEAEYAWENETPEGTRQMAVAAVGGTIDDYLDQYLVERIHLSDIHSHTKGDGILVAVIDTGVLASHPALDGVVVAGGWDFVDDDDDPTDAANGIDDDADGVTDEGAGHGTMVAGIIHLIAPNAKILPIRVLDDEGWGDSFRVAKAIQYAVEQGADLINLSLGMTEDSMVIEYEVGAAETVSIPMISAAGNLGTEEPEYYPARDNGVLSVAALDSSDVKADFSSYNESVGVSAPGVGVMAPYYDGEYAIGAGTSFAVPFVTGQCALILSLNPSLTIDEVYQYAQLGVAGIYEIPGNEPFNEQLGTGRIDMLETWLSTPAAASIDPIAASLESHWSVYPNPARLGDPIFFRMAEGLPTLGLDAVIYDARGRKVRSIVVGTTDASGGALSWDGLDHRGHSVPVGAYFIRLVGEDGRDRRMRGRVVVLKP